MGKNLEKITVSGACGTGKTGTAKALAQRLGYEYLSVGQYVRQCAEEAGVSIEQFIRSAGMSKIDVVTDAWVAEHGRTNTKFVFEGRLTWHFIPDALHILLTTEIDIRAERRARDEEEPDVSLMRRKLQARDEVDRNRFKQPPYRIADFTDSELYDLVVATDEVTIEQTVDMICSHLASQTPAICG